MKKLKKNKKAYFFSLDAFISLLIILGVVLFIKPPSSQVSQEPHIQEDLLVVLSSLEIGEIDNAYAQQLITNGNITNLNQSVLEQIGEFYANSKPEAEILADSILNDLSLNENIGLYFEGITISTSGSIPFTSANKVWTSRQIISGIQGGSSATGYSSRAFLFANNNIDYFYFGGYIGDGNLTVKLTGDIIGANIEAAFSGDFELYINNNPAGTYTPPVDIPYKINLNSYIDLFSPGENYIDFRSTERLYIAGGFIKTVYNDTATLPLNYSTHNFPGINGLINIYDSFYVPENLNSMEIFLHYNSSYDVFLTIGNTEVYQGNSGGSEISVTLDDSYLSGLLDYSKLTKKTIPIRFGLEDVYYEGNITELDVFSVTDLSGSMSTTCTGGECGSGINKMDLAKEANRAFINAILSFINNQVGLVGYKTSADEDDYHALSKNINSLNNTITSWSPTGATCVCCGINKAAEKMNAEARINASRSMIIMSDGKANVKCSQQGTNDPLQDAIQAACDAYDNYNITVHALAFGEDADETTLQSIASCGNGNYYYSEISTLIEVYEEIAQDIINASYLEQTIIGEDIFSELYPDSYFSIDYLSSIPYGLVITAETPEFGNTITNGSFIILNNTIPYRIDLVSYSGSRWTDKVEIYNFSSGLWENIFNLSQYNLDYIDLGDPYFVNIPLDKIKTDENLIRVSTGLNPLNSSGGSIYNKVIYSVIKNISSFSPIVSSAQGCIWNITFEDDSTALMSFPKNYAGSQTCTYNPSGISYNNNDAIDYAIYLLLTSLDLNSNRKIETIFSESDLTINSIEVAGIPFTWETEVQTRIWT